MLLIAGKRTMPSKDHNDQESAVIQVCMVAAGAHSWSVLVFQYLEWPSTLFAWQAAQDSSVGNPDTREVAEQNLPDSPRTDGEWEVVEASNRASDCESIPR